MSDIFIDNDKHVASKSPEKKTVKLHTENNMMPCPDNWSLNISVDNKTLASQNPAADIINAVSHYANVSPHQKVLYIIVIELYNNAVEHGLLKLDSAIKSSTSGFDDYYKNKQESIKTLQSGRVDIHVKYVRNTKAGELHITVQDTGDGFDYQSLQTMKNNMAISPYGRGLNLVKELCSELNYSGNGNTVTAIYSL